MQKPKRVESIPLFAQPLEKAGGESRPAGRRLLTPGMTLAILMTGTCAALLLIARPDAAQNVPAAKKSATVNSKKRIVVAENTGTQTGRSVGSSAGDTTSARRPISFYTQEVRGSMFSAPQPPAPKPPPAEKPRTVVVPPVKVDPWATWSYNGTVTVGEEKMALLENTQTKEGQWVHPGDNFMGAKIDKITDQMVTLTSAGKPHMLAKADTIVITPLDRSASYLTPQQPQQPSAAQQLTQALSQVIGQAAGGNQRQSGPSIMLPNGQILQGGRAQRYQQFMNNRFNGGGGGFGGGGFGGGNGGGGGRRNRGGNGGGG